MSSGKPLKIAIFGLWKTGTTAHLFKIKNSLPADTREIHEPSAYLPLPEDEKHFVLARVITGLSLTENSEIADYESFMGFDKKIYMVRDPRDWLVSAILYNIHFVYDNEDHLNRILDLLERKEKTPDSVSFIEIMKLSLTFMREHTYESFIDWVTRQYNWSLTFEKRLGSYCISRYEEFVDGNMSVLEEYLGMELHGAALVGKGHEHKSRTKSYGDWKNWFTKEDIELFKPIFAAYMDQYGYTDEWEINDPQVIYPEHCTEFVKKTVLHQKKMDMEKTKKAIYFQRIKRLIRKILLINS
jgi:hypothetical protein